MRRCNDDDNGDRMKSRALYIRDVSTNYQYYRIGTLFITEDGTQTIAWKMMDIPDEEQTHLPSTADDVARLDAGNHEVTTVRGDKRTEEDE